MPRTIKPAVNIITRDGLPALDVKVQTLPHWPGRVTIAATYGVSEADAERMRDSLWNIGVEDFWVDAERIAHELLPRGAVYSEGRSGGWLVVHGLGDVAAWTYPERRAWARFEREIRTVIAYRASAEWATEQLVELAAGVKEEQTRERVRDAAPEMLEALHALFDVLTVSGKHSYRPDSETGRAIEAARAAIAKAEGTA